ncbi:hypothetical protein Ciccas_011928 [Cichlidogyrus casuarinus]|uniref:Ca2+-activated K+ channel Slowpoke-like C-terminal domain-containing protein n=1 Tax=Cichlidogyrus casuarinus TaxID=1844966 RepID=A0ABD2PPV3_9PLAT
MSATNERFFLQSDRSGKNKGMGQTKRFVVTNPPGELRLLPHDYLFCLMPYSGPGQSGCQLKRRQ